MISQPCSLCDEIYDLREKIFAVAAHLEEIISRVTKSIDGLKNSNHPASKVKDTFTIKREIIRLRTVFVSVANTDTTYSLSTPQSNGTPSNIVTSPAQLASTRLGIAPPVTRRWRRFRRIKVPLAAPSLEMSLPELKILLGHLKIKLKELEKAQAYYNDREAFLKQWKTYFDRESARARAALPRHEARALDRAECSALPARKLLDNMMSKKYSTVILADQDTNPVASSAAEVSNLDDGRLKDRSEEQVSRLGALTEDQSKAIPEDVHANTPVTVRAPRTTISAAATYKIVSRTSTSTVLVREGGGARVEADVLVIPRKDSKHSNLSRRILVADGKEVRR